MIFYFSGTGNTAWAARQLAAATGEELMDIAACPDAKAAVVAASRGRLLGFCFPVHGWRPPLIVRRFVRQLRAEASGRYVFALCTCGDSVGRAMDLFRRDLAIAGLHAAGLFSLIMPESYVCLPLFRTDPPERERAKISAARAKLTDTIIPAIKAGRPAVSLTVGYLPYTYTYILGAWFTSRKITDRPFRTDAGLCTGCGRCVKACPVANISAGVDGRPVWADDGRCTACMACYHHCPHHAISYGRWTSGKGQYYFGKTHTPSD